MKEFFEKYIVFFITVLFLILIYKMFTFDDKLDGIKNDTSYLYNMIQKAEKISDNQ